MELRALLGALDDAERDRLQAVLGVRPDTASRLDPVERLARAWFRRPCELSRFEPEERRCLRMLT